MEIADQPLLPMLQEKESSSYSCGFNIIKLFVSTIKRLNFTLLADGEKLYVASFVARKNNETKWLLKVKKRRREDGKSIFSQMQT